MKIGIIGAGSWGTALGQLLAEKGNRVTLWTRSEDLAKQISEHHENKRYLPGVALSKAVAATTDPKGAVEDAEIVIIAVPSAFTREVIHRFKDALSSSCTLIHVVKGIEHDTGKLMTEVISEEIPGHEVAVLSGPNHAEEVARHLPTATTIAHPDLAVAARLCEVFSSKHFKAYPHDDAVGVQLCGAMKNIVAVAIGVIDGLGLGDNAKGSIITLGMKEMGLLVEGLGGKRSTCSGLAGVGDLVASCFSKHSRNRKAGELLAKGLSPEQVTEEMNGMVAEGVKNTKAIHSLCEKHGLEMPLVSQAHRVLYEGVDLKTGISELLDRV